MEKIIIIDTPKGSSVSIDLEKYKSVSINASTKLLDIEDDKNFSVSGTPEELKEIMSFIVDKKNIYMSEVNELTLREDVIKEASDKAISFGQEILRGTVIDAFKDISVQMRKEFEESLRINKELVSEVRKLKAEVKDVQNELNNTKSIISTLFSKLKELKSIIFSEEE